MEYEALKAAGLTEGESKVYICLLKLGFTTTGPLIKESGVANSIIYRILDSLVQKGLVSYVTREKTKYFQASDPKRILDYIEERKQKLEDDKEKISKFLPQLFFGKFDEGTIIRVYEGFRGIITAYENQYKKLKKGDTQYSLGIYPFQEEKYHMLWQRDHLKRWKLGIYCKLLFNMGTAREILKNRNSYGGCDARYMPSGIKTPAWIMIYKDVSVLFLQSREKPVAIEIVNQEIANTFMGYFDDYWKKSKPFK